MPTRTTATTGSGPGSGATPLLLLVALAGVGFVAAPHLVFQIAPPEPQMGFIQKIFYYHVPCSWLMLVSSVVGGIAGAVFLARRSAAADRLCEAATELAAVFGVLVMTTGPLWAKKAWGHYWVWDPRLTTMLILFLSIIGAMLARRFSGGLTGRRVAAGVALFAAINVPLVYISVRLFKTNHPDNTVVMTLDPAMRSALWVSLAAFSIFFMALLWVRLRLGRLSAELDALAAEASFSAAPGAVMTRPPAPRVIERGPASGPLK